MSHACHSLIALICLATLAGCGQKPDAPRAAATARPASTSPTQGQAKPARPAQEVAFIRECLAVGLRPTILLELESKALAAARGQAKQASPSKDQLQDMRANFDLSATSLHKLATSPAAGPLAKVPQLLGEARAKQAANCSRLPAEWLHSEGAGLMMLEFGLITARARNHQEADRKAGEYSKQNWPNLINLPIQQQAALNEILQTEQEIQRLIVELAADSELKNIHRDAIALVLRGLELRANQAANTLTSERLYASLVGTELRQRTWKIEHGEMMKLAVTNQQVIGHCIVSRIQLGVRGRSSGNAATFNLTVAHKIYADGRPALLLAVER